MKIKLSIIRLKKKLQVLSWQGEEHGPAILKSYVSLEFFLLIFFWSEGKKLPGDPIKEKDSLQVFLGRGFIPGGGCCFHCQRNCTA